MKIQIWRYDALDDGYAVDYHPGKIIEIDIAESELLQMYPKSKQGRFIIEYDLDGKARTTTTEEEPFELLRWQV